MTAQRHVTAFGQCALDGWRRVFRDVRTNRFSSRATFAHRARPLLKAPEMPVFRATAHARFYAHRIAPPRTVPAQRQVAV